MGNTEAAQERCPASRGSAVAIEISSTSDGVPRRRVLHDEVVDAHEVHLSPALISLSVPLPLSLHDEVEDAHEVHLWRSNARAITHTSTHSCGCMHLSWWLQRKSRHTLPWHHHHIISSRFSFPASALAEYRTLAFAEPFVLNGRPSCVPRCSRATDRTSPLLLQSSLPHTPSYHRLSRSAAHAHLSPTLGPPPPPARLIALVQALSRAPGLAAPRRRADTQCSHGQSCPRGRTMRARARW